MKVLILDGPNLNLTGIREPDIYGSRAMSVYVDELRKEFSRIQIEYCQSNHEGDIIDKLHRSAFNAKGTGIDAVILNAGAYTHYSMAIADAIRAIRPVPVIEVHISNVYAREKVRHESVIAPVCRGVIAGFGLDSYRLALLSLDVATCNK